jgi:hypothetical protein
VASILSLILLVGTIPLNFASNYWQEPVTKVSDWETLSAKFISNNFHGVMASSYKEFTVMHYYGGNFSGVFHNYLATGTPPDIFNASFIINNHIELVYITQLDIYLQSIYGRNISIVSPESIGFDCISSDSHSMVFINPVYP